MNNSEKVLVVLKECAWSSMKEISLKIPELAIGPIRTAVGYLKDKEFVRVRCLIGKDGVSLLHQSYQYNITKQGIKYLNKKGD